MITNSAALTFLSVQLYASLLLRPFPPYKSQIQKGKGSEDLRLAIVCIILILPIDTD